MNSIYLDHNTTTPIDPAVVEAMRACQMLPPGNPASQHAAGRRARQLLEETRDAIARILGAAQNPLAADRLLFTSGGTESNNLALRGLVGDPPGRLIVSSIEHLSVLAVAGRLRDSGWQVDLLRALPSGRVDLNHLDELLAREPRPRVVSVMWANNETGVLQPVAEVARRCRQAGIRCHCDAVQGVGKLPVDFRSLDVDAMSLSAHKFSGPCGIGALLLRHGVRLEPQLFGGHQQWGLRPGSEPVALAVGMLAALRRWEAQAPQRAAAGQTGRDTFERQLLEADAAVVVNGSEPRLPQTSNLSFLGLDRQALWMALDLAGLECSTGSACSSGASEPSHVLLAMGLTSDRVDSALRFSLGYATTMPDVMDAADRILRTVKHLRRCVSAANSSPSSREPASEAV